MSESDFGQIRWYYRKKPLTHTYEDKFLITIPTATVSSENRFESKPVGCSVDAKLSHEIDEIRYFLGPFFRGKVIELFNTDAEAFLDDRNPYILEDDLRATLVELNLPEFPFEEVKRSIFETRDRIRENATN